MSQTSGYMTVLKTALVQGLRECFDADYPQEDFRDLLVDIEFPNDVQSYPSIWVNYTDSSALVSAGIDHHEFTDPGDSGYVRRFTRWRFSGTASFTVVALSSLERDRLYDEMVRVIAFARESDQVPEFRAYIEDNEFIAMNANFDEIEPTGNSAAPGTPWGSDEYIYEITLNIDVIGEFISDGETGSLAPLSMIKVIGRPAFPDSNGVLSYPDEVQFPLGPSDSIIESDAATIAASSQWH
jgi:hypothetical protein